MTMPAVVDFYGQCVDGLIAYLKVAMADYFLSGTDVNIGRNDAKLNAGGKYFLFFRPGSFPLAGSTPNRLVKEISWMVMAELYARYNEYETSWANFEKARAALIWSLGIDPALSMYDMGLKNIASVLVEATGDALPFRSTRGFGTFIVQPLRFTITQRVKFPLYYHRSP